MRLPRLVRSAAFRFVALYTAVFMLCVLAVGWVSGREVTGALLRQATERARSEAEALANQFIAEGPGELRLELEARLANPQRRLRYALFDAAGRLTEGDPSLASIASRLTKLPPHEDLTIERVAIGHKDTILLVVRRLAPTIQLAVVDDLEGVEEVERVFSRVVFTTLALACVFGLFAGTLLAAALLRRVDRITRTAEAVIAGDFTHRVERNRSGDDFDRLSATLNVMLERIVGLMENLKQVSNDIAHDLRTPLAHLRQELEQARTRSGSLGDYEAAVERAIETVDNLLATFSALLRIAQIEAGVRRSAFRAVDLSEVIQSVGDAYEPAIEDARHVFERDVTADLVVLGDRELLQQLFANLIDNALAHTPPRTRLKLWLGMELGAPVARLQDNGPGIPADERSKVLRRFYRLERSRTSPGNGLGLSLVAAIVDLHGGQLTLRDNNPGLTVEVRFGSVEAPWAKHDPIAASSLSQHRPTLGNCIGAVEDQRSERA